MNALLVIALVGVGTFLGLVGLLDANGYALAGALAFGTIAHVAATEDV
jgi:hypothetical protein